jgi:tRNA(Met) cytidine acetyltransferase
MQRHRRIILLRGSAEQTRDTASRLLERLDPEAVLWISREEHDAFSSVRPRRVRRLLGRSYDAVVVDFHDRLDADVLGQSHGFVWGGGSLLLRLPPEGRPPSGGRERFAVHPYRPEDVGVRFYRHLERALGRAEVSEAEQVSPAVHARTGTAEQETVARQLTEMFRGVRPDVAALVADRGRGKSSAIGMAIREALTHAALRVAVTAGSRESAAEIFRFAGDDESVRFVPATELALADESFDVVAVDEAAQLPVPLLQRIVGAHPDARLVFATTTHGYEGTGRGFTHRFLEWVSRQPRRLHNFTLEEPIRWGAGDPLEAFVFDALLLDAEPPDFSEAFDVEAVDHVALDRDELVADERLLREYFGLLIQAHYRTTPGDLHRLLDAPNLHLHASLHRGHVVAATMVAEEGDLPAETVHAIYRGRRRVRGHALAETIVSHLGRRDAGRLEMIRSVRIATHPDLRRRGLGTALIEHVHRCYDPDLFGTLFGATPGLLQFRRSVGYELVRVGASRGSRTGEPAAVMMRPVTDDAHRLFEDLRGELARDLPLQLELLEAGNELLLDSGLRGALLAGLPEPAPLTEAELRETVALYAFGPRTYESAATALEAFVRRHRVALDELETEERALIVGRVVERRSWADVTGRVGMSSVRVTMRALRRAIRALVEHVEPSLEPNWS